MKFRKNILLSTSILALISQMPPIFAEDQVNLWQARNLEQVLNELVIDDNNQVTYTVQEGDTLGVIAEAMKIDLHYLANINGIQNVDLIFPGNKLVAQFNQDQQAISLTIYSPEGEQDEVDLPVNLSVQSQDFIQESTNTQESELGQEAASLVAPAQVTEWVDSEVVEEAVAQAPIVEEAVVEVPIADEVVTEVPFVEEVATEAPIAEEVVTEVSFVDEVVTEAPIADEVVTEVPFVDEVVTEVPIAEEVATEAPIVDEVVTEAPIADEVATEAPIVDEVATEAPIVEETSVASFDPMSNPENAGLQPYVAAFKEEVASIYGVDSFSLYRPGDPGDHGTGRAVDFMVPVGSQVGTDIANYSIANMAENNISYVIWEQAIYGNWTGGQWEPMEDRGSLTANHYDHVHVSFY